MTRDDWILAIDFGTSNTAAAHINPVQRNIEAINLSYDNRTMPSSVYVESPDDISTGSRALERAEDDPSGLIPSPKRVVPRHTIHIKGLDIPASHAVGAVLADAIAAAKKYHNDTPPARLVLTHPEVWSDREIGVLIDGAERAGIDRSKISTLSEPKAAAHYYSQGNHLSPGDTLAIFDIGGGTLDVAVLVAQPDGSFRVTSADGDNGIGGKTFDALIRRWVDEQLLNYNGDLHEYFRTEATSSEHQALETSIRRAKETLSEDSSATITVRGGGMSEKLLITREEFEQLITPAVDRAVDLTRGTLNHAGIDSTDQLRNLYLTGGSSRVPLLQERLKELGPVGTLDDPKTVVSQGAVVHALRKPASRPSTQAQPRPQRPQQPQRPQAQPMAARTVPARTRSNPAPAPAPAPAPSPAAAAAPSRAPQQLLGNYQGAAPAKKKSNTPLIAGGIAASVLVIGLVGWFALGDWGGSTTTTSTTQTEINEAEKWDHIDVTVDSKVSDDDDELLRETVPATMLEGVSECHIVPFESVDSKVHGTIANCAFDPRGAASEYLNQEMTEDDNWIGFLIDDGGIKRTDAYININRHESGRLSSEYDVAGPVKSDDGTRIAIAFENEDGIDIQYADEESEFQMVSSAFKSPDAAIEWLESLEVI